MLIVHSFCLCVIMCKPILSDVFLATSSMASLLKTEAALIETLKTYIQAQEEKLDTLKKYKDDLISANRKANQGVKSNLQDPINFFLVVKRFAINWNPTEELIKTNVGLDSLLADLDYYRNNQTFATDLDLNGAVTGLTRLQKTYNLETSSLANGEIKGTKFAHELSVSDCFEIGKRSYEQDNYRYAYSWMRETRERLHRVTGSSVSDHSVVLEYLINSKYELGDIEMALNLTNQLLKLDPTHDNALQYKVKFENKIANPNSSNDSGEYATTADTDQEWISDHTVRYEQLCRGDISTPHEILSKLKCRYENNEKSFLKIAPFKVEEIYKDPQVLIFHDVMSDKEIATIKRAGRSRLQRTAVVSKEGQHIPAEYRICKGSWLYAHDHVNVAKLSQRTEDMTGLSMTTAEATHLINYGIGGHYLHHYDFVNQAGSVNAAIGDRIATVLFYMSDVSEGGATVFPIINATVWPKKGTAVFWYNLHSHGIGDSRTLHGGCPVLIGSKWISTKWIHEVGQEFRRPCDLVPPLSEPSSKAALGSISESNATIVSSLQSVTKVVSQ